MPWILVPLSFNISPMFKIDFQKHTLYTTPQPMRQKVRIYWIILLLSPLRALWQTFLGYRSAKLYEVNHTGQVIYLEKVLNDLFDNIQRRIEVVDGDFSAIKYIYQRSEALPFFVYYRWEVDTDYVVGDQVRRAEGFYRCLVDNTALIPEQNPAEWGYETDQPLIQFRAEYFERANFVVLVPAGLNYDLIRMQAVVNYYKIAGRTYKIIEV